VAVFRLEDALRDQEAPDWKLEKLLKDAEEEIAFALQLFPGDPYLLSEEARLASLLADDAKAVQSLDKAFAGNPRNAYVARTLGRLYWQKGRTEDALRVLVAALEAKPQEKSLHYTYGRMLLDSGCTDLDLLEFHFRRSYTDGDSQYDAQVLHARTLFARDGGRAAKPVFRKTARAKTSVDAKREPRYPLSGRYRGRLERLEDSYAIIEMDGKGDWVNCQTSRVDESVSSEFRVGLRVSFRIAFSMLGPEAIDVARETDGL
jgi:tetratricopeptide (TPR) repeat protein